jgi:hypothetical protein
MKAVRICQYAEVGIHALPIFTWIAKARQGLRRDKHILVFHRNHTSWPPTAIIYTHDTGSRHRTGHPRLE